MSDAVPLDVLPCPSSMPDILLRPSSMMVRIYFLETEASKELSWDADLLLSKQLLELLEESQEVS